MSSKCHRSIEAKGLGSPLRWIMSMVGGTKTVGRSTGPSRIGEREESFGAMEGIVIEVEGGRKTEVGRGPVGSSRG